MITQLVEMTPEWAGKIMATNLQNRRLNTNRVRVIARAIQNGQWKLSHQGILLDADGNLQDGQHRLAGIHASGQTVPIMLSQMEPGDEDVFDVIDTGRARGARDALTLAGFHNVNVLPVAVRLVEHYVTAPDSREQVVPKIVLTTADILERVGDDHRYQQWANDAERLAVNIGRRGFAAGLLAGIVIIDRAAGEALPGSIREFVAKVEDPVMLPSDSPILAYRRWINVTVPLNPNRNRGLIVMTGFIRAWNAWIEGRDLARIRVNIERDGLPEVAVPMVAGFSADAREEPVAEPVEQPVDQ